MNWSALLLIPLTIALTFAQFILVMWAARAVEWMMRGRDDIES